MQFFRAAVVVLFELSRRYVTYGFEETMIVKPPDPFQGSDFDVFESSPRTTVPDDLSFVKTDHLFGESIVFGGS